jgi:predicted regulator of Ras-like GTPase activity (Roadblock/LC7/MglB family)
VRTQVAEPWIELPLQTFVDDARALFALLLHPSGQVMGQFGFTRAVDVMAACALAAAIHASAGELGRELDGKPFRELYHAGRDRQIFIGDVPTTRQRYVFLTVFDSESSLGLVRIYFQELCALLEHAQPAVAPATPIPTASLEHGLNHNLAILFGRAPRGEDGETPFSLA